MKSMTAFVVSSFLMLSILCVGSYARAACPPGTMEVIDPGTNKTLCYISGEYGPDGAGKTEDDDILINRDKIRSSGLVIDLAVGYGLIAAFNVRLSGGYHFKIASVEGLGFGLYTDFSIRYPFPQTLDWAVVPMIHVYGDIFRVSFGFGAGVFKILGVKDFYFESLVARNTTLFQLKAEMRMDWFLSEHFLIGMGIDFPLIFYKESFEHPENHTFLESRAFPWFSLNAHVGYKF